jgi:zinc/manganese transport system ATP-binding protein
VSAVSLDRASLALGGRPVLSAVSLEIAEGELVGVLGPNGAGKTTLMRAILGLLRPSGGAIRVLGQRPGRANAAIGYMPQQRSATAGLLLRGRDVVACAAGGAAWGLPILGAARRAEVDRALETVGAAALAARPLGELSGGERQRLLLAQALLGRPRLLLLDEPLMNLDPRHQGAVVALVRDLQRRLGITVLLSAHEINPLLGALDRVLYLGSGQAALGTVDEVIRGEVLSRLYGSPIEVVRVGGRIFVMSGGHNVEHDEHRHGEHAEAHAASGHGHGDGGGPLHA